MKFRNLILFFTLVFAGCATKPTDPDEVRLDSGYYLQWDRGFQQVISYLPENPEMSEFAILHEMALFRQKLVRWATLEGQNYISLESTAYNETAWLVIIPENHAILKEPGSTLTIDVNPEIHVLQIRPEKVTEIWAGIFLIHELSHLYDRVFGLEPVVDPTREEFLMGEFRAYYLEMMAVNMVSDFGFQQELDRLILQHKPQTDEEILNLLSEFTHEDLMTLDGTVSGERPLSEAEAGMRLGFYQLAIILRVGELTGMDIQRVLSLIGELYA